MQLKSIAKTWSN